MIGAEALVKEDTNQTASWVSPVIAARHEPAARILNVDLLAVLIAIFLPWSTTGVLIFAVLWAVALMWTFIVASPPQKFAGTGSPPRTPQPYGVKLTRLVAVQVPKPWSTSLALV